MNHPIIDRIFIEDLERLLNVHFKKLKCELKGKGQDGITAAQKKALHAWGVNTSGIRYKGTACEIMNLLDKRKAAGLPSPRSLKHGKTDPVFNGLMFRVKKIGHTTTMSPEMFATLTEAEYYAAKRVSPDFDVRIISFKPKYTYALITNNVVRYFPTRKNAEFYQKRNGGKIVRYTCC